MADEVAAVTGTVPVRRRDSREVETGRGFPRRTADPPQESVVLRRSRLSGTASACCRSVDNGWVNGALTGSRAEVQVDNDDVTDTYAWRPD